MRLVPMLTGSFVALTTFACGKSAPPAETAPTAAEVAPAPAPDVAAAAPDVAAAAPDVAAVAPDAAAATPDAAPAAPDVAAVAPDVAAEPDAAAKIAPGAVPAATAVSGECLPSEDTLQYIALAGRKLQLCTHDYEKPPQCWDLDLDAATFAKAPVPKVHEAHVANIKEGIAYVAELPKEVKVPADRKSIESCIDPKACVKLDIEGSHVGQVEVSRDRVLVAPEYGAEEAGPDAKPMVRLFDGKTGKLLGKLAYANLGSDCPTFSWAGDFLYVEAGVCAGPGATGAFYDLSGKKVADLGGKADVAAYGVRPFELPSGQIAFREQYGEALFLHDGKTSAFIETLNLEGTLVKVDGELSTSPEEGEMLMSTAPDGALELVIVNGGESRRRVVVIDPVAVSVKRVLELTVCAPK